MAIKIGQRLLQAKLITPSQLDEALKTQAIFGGRIGSQLLENGAIDEVTLAKQLGEAYRVPYAYSTHLAKLPQELLGCIPGPLVEKYLVIPLKREKQRLYLAMADPGDLAAIEEIGFRTGFVIRPVIVPEALIIRHLKQYYGINRVGNYVAIEDDQLPQASKPAKPAKKETDDPGTWLGGPEQDAIMAEWEQKNREEQLARNAGGAPPREEATAEPRLESLGERIAAHLDREQMADLIIEHINLEYATGALLLVRGNSVVGWRAVRDRQPVADFQQLQLPLDQPSALQTVSFNKNAYAGPLAPLPVNQQLVAALGSQAQGNILVTPVMLLGRLIALIFIDNPKLNYQMVINEVHKISAMLAIGLEMLILKNKLASM